jgi:hypothetical protein
MIERYESNPNLRTRVTTTVDTTLEQIDKLDPTQFKVTKEELTGNLAGVIQIRIQKIDSQKSDFENYFDQCGLLVSSDTGIVYVDKSIHSQDSQKSIKERVEKWVIGS